MRLTRHRRRPVALVAVLPCVLLAASSCAHAAASVRPATQTGPLGDERLSDEATLSRYARTAQLAAVRRNPSTRSSPITRLRWLTEDGRPEVYLALRSRLDASGQAWIKIRLPRRPNGSTGWVPQWALGPLHVTRSALEIDRKRLTIRLRQDGRVVWTSRIGIGAPATPTPAGRFYVREKLHNTFGDPLYGPWAIGTSAYSGLADWPSGGVIGIHGTDRPTLIPGRPSHGCIRLRNSAITALAARLAIGTPIWIH